jgi:hypothetical protein
MKAVVYQVPREFAVTSAPDPGPDPGLAEVRLRTSGRGRTRAIAMHVPELDDRARALSPFRDGAADLKAVLAP